MFYNLKLINLASNDELKANEEDLQKTKFVEVKPGTFVSKGGNIFNFISGAEFKTDDDIIGVAKENIKEGESLEIEVTLTGLKCDKIDFK